MWTDALTPLRWLYRGLLFLLHIGLFTPLTVLAQGRLGHRLRFGQRSLAEWFLNTWAAMTCRIFGVRPPHCGRLPPGPLLVVANHISWLDIQVLHSVAALSFVAKAEIEDWPLAGFLASRGGTVFHQRGSHDSASDVTAKLMQKLAAGERVCIFPEGGIRPGEAIKPFHARMFKVAVEADCTVQPAMVRYLRDGRRDPELTFLVGENFLTNILRLLGRPGCRAELRWLEPFRVEGRARKDLAQQAYLAINEAYESAP